MPRKFIAGIHLKKGALHRQLGIAKSKKIPKSVLRKAARAKGRLGKRARFAVILERFRHCGAGGCN